MRITGRILRALTLAVVLSVAALGVSMSTASAQTAAQKRSAYDVCRSFGYSVSKCCKDSGGTYMVEYNADGSVNYQTCSWKNDTGQGISPSEGPVKNVHGALTSFGASGGESQAGQNPWQVIIEPPDIIP